MKGSGFKFFGFILDDLPVRAADGRFAAETVGLKM